MKEKILIFITASYPYGLSETFIESEIMHLANEFDKIVIIPLSRSQHDTEREYPANVEIRNYQKKKMKYLSSFNLILKNKQIRVEFYKNLITKPLKNKVLIKSIKEALSLKDFIEKTAHCEENKLLFFYSYWLNDAAIALSLLKRPGIKISRAHGWDIYRERHLYHYLPLRKHLAKNLDGIYSISQHGQKELLKQTDCDNIYVSRLGTENNYQFDIGPAPAITQLNIISIGNAIPLKRLHLIGEAIKLMKPGDYHWIHFGDGPLLAQLKTEYPFADFRGQVSNIEIKNQLNLLKSNAILINTSTSEGIPVSMMEAMSFGIPCVGTYVGGVSEIIENNFNGFLLSPDPNLKELAALIRKIASNNKDEMHKLKINARNTWLEKYNAPKNYPAFIKLAFSNIGIAGN
ncbi:MAG: glycosyltransferase [Cyclobacteriaceae bacterium]